MNVKENITIGAVGAGGDGVALFGELLQRLGAAQGYFGKMPRYYGAQIRGGDSAVKLNFNSEYSALPNDILDVLVMLNWERYAKFGDELCTNEQTLILCEAEPPEGIVVAGKRAIIKFTEISKERTASPRNKNILALGVVAGLLGMRLEVMREVIDRDEYFGIVKKNLEIFIYGFSLAILERNEVVPAIWLQQPLFDTPKMVVCGNDMIVKGALDAGCTAGFGYPITPATEIGEDLARHLALEKDCVWRQAEDEIAAIMNGIGASLTGAKVLIPTSGPGLSLMTEALGFAVGTEVPLVIANVQRGGPSTGAPTKTEQSDLNHALYGGHGDGPRIVVAPHDIESAYTLTRTAFDLSEDYQTPVILLSDQYLGQTPTALDRDFLDEPYEPVRRKRRPEDASGEYLRFKDTHDFISPMADIGDADGIYQTSGLCHREDGSHDASLETMQKWHNKLASKLVPLRHRADLVRIYGNMRSQERIITWGSSKEAVLAATSALGLMGRVAICVPELISPLPRVVADFAETAEELMIIEMNASGQFAKYLRTEAFLPRNYTAYHRSGGRPFGINELKRVIWICFGLGNEKEGQ